MFHEKIKSLFSNAVHSVSSTISEFTVNPGSDLTRDRKLPAEKLITFLVSQGASSSKNELLDFFDMDPQAPTASALNQQRAKLRPEALEMVFRLLCVRGTFCKGLLQHAPECLLRPSGAYLYGRPHPACPF